MKNILKKAQNKKCNYFILLLQQYFFTNIKMVYHMLKDIVKFIKI